MGVLMRRPPHYLDSYPLGLQRTDRIMARQNHKEKIQPAQILAWFPMILSPLRKGTGSGLGNSGVVNSQRGIVTSSFLLALCVRCG